MQTQIFNDIAHRLKVHVLVSLATLKRFSFFFFDLSSLFLGLYKITAFIFSAFSSLSSLAHSNVSAPSLFYKTQELRFLMEAQKQGH